MKTARPLGVPFEETWLENGREYRVIVTAAIPPLCVFEALLPWDRDEQLEFDFRQPHPDREEQC